jgi:LuxR family maltose regulon positive regulatory protein
MTELSISPPPPRLLHTKLSPPAALPRQIVRQAVVDAVCGAQGVKLVLLRAPAGFGKSTVMLQCLERLKASGMATAWLTIDHADNDASRFLAGLERAAGALSDGDEDEPRAAAPDAGTVGDVALRVIARIARHDRPFALFLDDFEAVHEPGVLALLREVIEHLPPQGRLVIGSRSIPDLRLGRLRARGQLLEIDAARLRFSLDETAAFFTARRAEPLAFDDLARLHAKTEGWVAALWLASAAIERSPSPGDFIERFSGTEQSVSEYLAEDVLARQSPQARDFLLRTSILRHLEASLCDALVPGVDSRQMLGELAAADVLLVPMGMPGTTYRYHSLFARFLQDQLAREAPGEVRGLHGAASAWFEAHARPVPAIDHAVEGGDAAHAIALLRVHAPRLLAQGRMRLLARWFAALPPDALDGEPRLQLVHMWSVCFTRGPREPMEMLERSGLGASSDPEVLPQVRALRPILLAMTDRYEEAYAVGRESLEHLPSAVPFADNVLANAMATIVGVMGEHEQARRLIDAARRGQGTDASEFNLMYSESAEGAIDLQEGRLRQAKARFRLAVTATPGHGTTSGSGNAWGGVPYAVSLYESDQLDEAAHLLQVYLPLARDVGLPDLVAMGYGTLSRIVFWRGDVDQSLQLLTELEYIGHTRQLPRVVACTKIERSRVLLLQGHHRAAREELERIDDPELWKRVARLRFMANDHSTLEIGLLRWELHAGDPQGAAERLGRAADAALAEGRRRRALKLQLMRAVALHRADDVSAALAGLRSVLTATCAEGFVRLVLDEGDIVRPAVHALDAWLGAAPGPKSDPVFADYVKQLASALGPVLPPTAATKSAGPALLLEPLTRKEIRVLQLLGEGYSNGAMAEKLFVSDSTIRTHLRNINTKLDAHSRTQAVAVARRVGLIP